MTGLAYLGLKSIRKRSGYSNMPLKCRTVHDRDPILLSINTWPNVPDNLKNDPRCQDIIRRVNFPV